MWRSPPPRPPTQYRGVFCCGFAYWATYLIFQTLWRRWRLKNEKYLMYTIVLIIFLTLDYITPQWLNSYARAFRFIEMMDNKSFRHKFLFWNASHAQVGFSGFSVVIKEAGKFMIIFSRNKIKRMWPVLELWRIFLLNYTINTVSFCCGLTLRLHDMNISEFLEEGKTWKYN